MITIKGWHDRKDMYVISKAYENIAVETAVQMIESVKDGPAEGRIRMPGNVMFGYNRYPNGRIVIRQLA